MTLDDEWHEFIRNHKTSFGIYNLDTSLSSLKEMPMILDTPLDHPSETKTIQKNGQPSLPGNNLSPPVTLIKNSTTSAITDIKENAEILVSKPEKLSHNDLPPTIIIKIPEGIVCDELSISTKTKVLYLNTTVDIHNIFWKIPIIDNWRPIEGIVKKQIKIVSHNQAEVEAYKEKLNSISFYREDIIKQVNNPNARIIQFKDERKLTVGLSIKDIVNKEKTSNVFYNCIAIIARFLYEGVFKEIHVKIFNTGKLEIPGILNVEILEIIKNVVISIIKPHMHEEEELFFMESCKADDENAKNILINSNFNCGFYIDREKLQHIMSNKYGIETAYDPCSYPGVKCKFYFKNDVGFDINVQKGIRTKVECQAIDENVDTSPATSKEKVDKKAVRKGELIAKNKYSEISFMIFRTGSVLISGSISEKILKFVYHFIKEILMIEYKEIYISGEKFFRLKNIKGKKININVTPDFFKKIQEKQTV